MNIPNIPEILYFIWPIKTTFTKFNFCFIKHAYDIFFCGYAQYNLFQLLPALDRMMCLLGVDVFLWYRYLPRTVNFSDNHISDNQTTSMPTKKVFFIFYISCFTYFKTVFWTLHRFYISSQRFLTFSNPNTALSVKNCRSNLSAKIVCLWINVSQRLFHWWCSRGC